MTWARWGEPHPYPYPYPYPSNHSRSRSRSPSPSPSPNPGQVVLPSRSAQHSCLAAAVHLTDDVGEVGRTPPSPWPLTLRLALYPYNPDPSPR